MLLPCQAPPNWPRSARSQNLGLRNARGGQVIGLQQVGGTGGGKKKSSSPDDLVATVGSRRGNGPKGERTPELRSKMCQPAGRHGADPVHSVQPSAAWI